MRLIYLTLAAVACVVAAILPASAQISFTLNNDTQSGYNSDSPLFFSINFANGPLASTIHGFSATFFEPDAPATDMTPFFDYMNSINGLNQPIIPNFSDPNVTMFTVNLTGAKVGTFSGIASILYDTDGTNILESAQGFSVTVNAPEPGPLALLGVTGILGLGLIHRRHHLLRKS